MNLIVEVWCSPLRGEIYDHSHIVKSTCDYGFDEDLANYLDGTFFVDVFGQDHETVKGLWKVVFELEIQYSRDYLDEYDTDYYIEKAPYKSKCKNYEQLKQVWLSLNGKGEEYYNKPYRKNSGLFQFESV